MKKSWFVPIATLGPIGYIQGSGTLATIVTLPCIYYMQLWNVSSVALFIAMLAGIALIVVHKALRAFPGQHDPSAIVIDEVLGCLITFCGVALTSTTLIIGFGLFRILDIAKPLGIARVERYKAPWGILLDDCAAGIIANLCMQVMMVSTNILS